MKRILSTKIKIQQTIIYRDNKLLGQQDSQEAQDLVKVLRIIQWYSKLLEAMDNLEYNICRIMASKKLFKDRLQVKELKRPLLMKHQCQKINSNNGEKSSGVSNSNHN